MEQAPTTSSANEMQSDMLAKDGYFDYVYSIFKAQQHPIVVVEESALRWMGLRVFPEEDLDLLIRDSSMKAIQADLLATGRFELVEQDLVLRFSDTYTRQVPRLRLEPNEYIPYSSISLWSESVYMLKVDGARIEIPDTHAWNVVLKEDRFDLHPSWAKTGSISYSTRIADGVMVLPPIRSQSADMKYPIEIPTIPRMLDALLDQARYRATHSEEFSLMSGNRPLYHLQASVRYLQLDKPQQQERVFSELAERNREMMEGIANKFKRKPLLTPANFLPK